MVFSSDSIVKEYAIPLPIQTTNDNIGFLLAAQDEAIRNGIKRPKGYKVSWHLNPEIEKHHFGRNHPMKPWRLTLAKGVIMSYGMNYAMDSYNSRQATREELADFHSSDYLDFLQSVLPREPVPFPDLPHNLGGEDCPIFEGIFDYCSMYAGASIDAARKLINNESDIAVNWSGGLHHAKKAEASGFCYMNDIVLAILQLLRHHPRVLYIDIDVHHGDGVEEAFMSTDRVLTVSFHKYDREVFFPGTGPLESTGPEIETNPGAHHAINVPLNDGIDDESYTWLFKTIIQSCVDRFQPSAIVLQCGADSLAGDRLGPFNLQVQGHGACVAFCKSLRLPLLLVGGGGYTPRNVARAWANETSIAIGCDATLDPTLPLHTPYRSHFRQTTLFPTLEELHCDSRANKNTPKRLQEIVSHITDQLRFVTHAPSVQMREIPPDLGGLREEVEDEIRDDREAGDEVFRKEKEEAIGTAMEL
ncbi:MAG: histone deacetylase [Claussenomyces sp. TS43310]|nr:MAG: histone deacetylase [Claussenomyces sp. TS43310]